MAKTGLLSPLHVGRETKPGHLCDGGGLYLQIKPTKKRSDPDDSTSKPVVSKSWLWRYKVDGKTRMMGLGPFPDVSLADAREKAASMRSLRHNGVDPHDAREAARLRQKLEAAQAFTFRQCAETFISSREADWKNAKQPRQRRSTLDRYAYQYIGDVPVGAISTRLVLNVLQQNVSAKLAAKGDVVRVGDLFWNARPETARRVRAYIEEILDWARVNQYREGDTPARWQGNLDQALSKTQKRQHHPALPYADASDFLKVLRV